MYLGDKIRESIRKYLILYKICFPVAHSTLRTQVWAGSVVGEAGDLT